jgi:hypothetical protein
MLLLVLQAAASCQAEPPIVVTDGQIALDVSPSNGALMAVRDVVSGIRLAPPADLADSFRLVLQTPDGATATIVGREQPVPAFRLSGAQLSIAWGSPLRDTAGAPRDLSVRMDIVADGGALTFVLHAENHDAGKAIEARYPLLGGLRGLKAPGRECDATLWVPTSTPWTAPVTPGLAPAVFGYPGHMNLSFACLQGGSAERSLYLASHDLIGRYKRYRFEETPGPGGSDLTACIEHVPFSPPGGTFDGSPVVVRFVDGDWHAAAQVYREWFLRSFGVAEPSRDWIRQQSFFLMTMFMLPEGTINFRFRDIPKWARAARDHGIRAVQISGWQRGGHDNGYPYYTIDPRLGTWEELEDGIRECHRMGLKVYFFVNYQPMMVDSDWYKTELHRYREMGPDGGLTWNTGWGMGTLWARMGHPKIETWADLGFPEFRKIIVDQFARLAEIGADGVHVDKMFPAAVDYNPDIPMGADTSTWQGALLLTDEIMRECRARNPNWAMSFECNWDRMISYGASTWWVGNQLITRQVFPENAETLGLYQAYDYLGVNNAVREGHIVMVAPLNFSRSLDWPPFAGLADYIREVKAIRDRLSATVFLGESLGPGGASLSGAPPDGVQWDVWRNREDDRRVCILTNSRMEGRSVTLERFRGRGAGKVRIHTPFLASSVTTLPAEITVPAERVVFVEELGEAR